MSWVIAQVWPWGWRALWSESRSVMSDSLQPQGLYSPWDSPGQNTGVGRLSLLQGIFPIQGSNPGLLHCRQILYQLSHKRSPLRALIVWKGNWSVWAQEKSLLNINHPFPLLCKGNTCTATPNNNNNNDSNNYNDNIDAYYLLEKRVKKSRYVLEVA